MAQPRIIGEFLTGQKSISTRQLNDALKELKESGENPTQIPVIQGALTEEQLVGTMESFLGIPRVQISQIGIEPEAVELIPPHLVRLHKILPISRNKNSITLAMAEPLSQQALDDVRMATGLEVIPVWADEQELETAISQYLAFQCDPGIERILSELKLESETISSSKSSQSLQINDEAPIIRLVNSIITQAVQVRSSDIHIEPQENNARVRFRIDGELYPVVNLPRFSVAATVSRIKILAGMDIAEKRIPQDGRFRIKINNHEVDLRVSTMPVAYGEKVVLRILDRKNSLTHVDQLGLSSSNRKLLQVLYRRPHGLLLVTGPTGSGKTTTLYSILNQINSVNKNQITLEDPIEYTINGINQVQINPRAGLTFANGLRSVLRQDPDTIMVGEIRDSETAGLAVQAALTGHLVLSTLHTNSAASCISRLVDMGIEKFLLSSSLAGVVSQRLVRKLCKNCRQKYVLDEITANRLGIPEESGYEFFHPQGCKMCRQTGYQGRIALHEVMVVGPYVREVINQREWSDTLIEQTALKEGMIPIRQDGVEKARQGHTSLEEVMKAVLLGG
ncbi:MAG: GspE/PulE family protein [Syntrophomonadaceae bacterium]|jgi:type IV pilus assembly protein PilB